MLIKALPVGQLETNCYIVTDEETLECAIIDPGAEANTILDYIETNNLKPRAIMLTHGHFDHCIALDSVMEEVDAPAYVHKGEITDDHTKQRHKIKDNGKLTFYSEGDVIKVGKLEFYVMETPGHSDGSVTLRCENALFTGDTLFRDSCGRTDLGGDLQTLMNSLKRLAELEGDYEVYPGHEEFTSLSRERSFNQYVKAAISQT